MKNNKQSWLARLKYKIFKAKDGKYIYVDETGGYWSVILFIKDAYTVDFVNAIDQAYEASKAFGKFTKQLINIDISKIGNFDPDEVKYKTGKHMLSLSQLNFYVDSLLPPYENYINNKAHRSYETLRAKKLYGNDTIPETKLSDDILENFSEDDKVMVLDNAIELARNNLNSIQSFQNIAKGKQKIINAYNTEYHKRLALSFACLVLFFIGAPLGSIIRKGGFGLPMIMAIFIFVVYFFISTFGEKMATSNTISPFFGGWLATIILLPFGLLLMKRAINDKGIFNIDKFLQPINNFFNKLIKNNKT